jgi:serine/threonine-protein kinase
VSVGTLALGTLFAGRYEVQAMLGHGGMGAVYRVRDVKLDEVVALKLLTLEGEVAIDRFLREVRLARRVTHPNVARTHDFGEDEGVRFLTMELVEGGTLDDLLGRQGVLPADRVAAFGAAIAAGLAAAHAAGVVHRDLKPGNVMLTADERVVITDFGIARATSGDRVGKETQAVVGTPTYMAPEQVSGGPVDARADLYALGAMLFELATGATPFEGDDAIAVAVARLHEEAPDPRERVAMPDALANLIMRCMAREPAARPTSAGDVHHALTGLAGLRSVTATTPSGSSVLSLYAPMTPGRRAVAVLPFIYRGSSEHDYLGDGLAEELIDVLSRTKGLKVLSSGATRRFADDRDPRRIGSELDAEAVVDGTVQLSGDRVRLSARLIDTHDGEQRWSDRFDGRFEDVFALQDQMGKRLAEALRVEITANAYSKSAPTEAIELYLRARKLLRSDIMVRAEEAVALLDESLQLAPGFAIAVAAHAMASVRAWWGTDADVDGRRAARARSSVERAVAQVPDLAETHQAQAMLAVQSGDFRTVAMALHRVLEIAPTMAEAHQYLGDIQMEAGREKEGRKRLALALELDPSLIVCHLPLARDAVFDGRLDEAAEHIAYLERAYPSPPLPILFSYFRVALYEGDIDRAKAIRGRIAELDGEASQRMVLITGLAFENELLFDIEALLIEIEQWLANARFTALIQQLFVEVFCVSGAHELALTVLERAAAGILIDISWLRRCPLFVELRSDPRFVEVQRIVAQRAADVWLR